MKRKVLFAHSAGSQGGPGHGSYDLVMWLRKSLGNKFEIAFPIISDPEAPTYEMWKQILDQAFSTLNDECIIIGHSLGGSVLLKYLSESQPACQIDGLFLVAMPYWGEQGWDIDDFNPKKDFAKNLPEISSVHLFHSKEDPIVPFEHLQMYRANLPNAVVHELDGNSHAFADGLTDLVEQIKNTK